MFSAKDIQQSKCNSNYCATERDMATLLENNKIKSLLDLKSLHKHKRTLTKRNKKKNSAHKPFELRDHDTHNISYETADL